MYNPREATTLSAYTATVTAGTEATAATETTTDLSDQVDRSTEYIVFVDVGRYIILSLASLKLLFEVCVTLVSFRLAS